MSVLSLEILRHRPRFLILALLTTPFLLMVALTAAVSLRKPSGNLLQLLLGAVPFLVFWGYYLRRWWRAGKPTSIEPLLTLHRAPQEIAWVAAVTGTRKNQMVVLQFCTTTGQRHTLFTTLDARQACLAEVRALAPRAVVSERYDPQLAALWKKDPAGFKHAAALLLTPRDDV